MRLVFSNFSLFCNIFREIFALFVSERNVKNTKRFLFAVNPKYDHTPGGGDSN